MHIRIVMWIGHGVIVCVLAAALAACTASDDDEGMFVDPNACTPGALGCASGGAGGIGGAGGAAGTNAGTFAAGAGGASGLSGAAGTIAPSADGVPCDVAS